MNIPGHVYTGRGDDVLQSQRQRWNRMARKEMAPASTRRDQYIHGASHQRLRAHRRRHSSHSNENNKVVRSRFDEAVAATAAVDGGWLGQFGAAQLDDELRNDERGAAGVRGRHGQRGPARRAFGALVAPKGK